MKKIKRPKVLSVLSLIAINIIAVDSLRGLPFGAEYGLSLIALYAIMAVLFFIPCALVVAELATAWPSTGGLYIWIREAFGPRAGFFVIFLQWAYNVVWFPTTMAFIASTILYVFDPTLVDNKLLVFSMIVSLFWIVTFINCLGMKASAILSEIGAVVGTLLPMLLIIVLAAIWLFMGKPSPASLTQSNWVPDLSSPNNYAFLSAILFGLIGLEMSAAHAGDVKNPKRDYPLALLASSVVIVVSLVLGSLAIAVVVPTEKLNIVTGLIQAYDLFFKAFQLGWATPILITTMVLGTLSGVGAWMIGPVKGIYAAATDGCLPKSFSRVNKKAVPYALLLIQAVIFTFLASCFLWMPNINSSYWILSDMAAQLALLVYIGLFVAAIYLRYKKPDVERAFKIPGGNAGLWLVCGCGIITSIAGIVLGFFPPSQLNVGNVGTFELSLAGGIALFCALPFLIYRKKKQPID